MTLTRRLLLLALISVLPAIVIWTYTEVTLRRAREAEVQDLALRQAQLAASEIERIFEGVRSLLVAVGEVPSVRALDTAACVPYLAALQPKVPYLVSIVGLDPERQVRCRQRAPPDERFDRPLVFPGGAPGERTSSSGEIHGGRIAKEARAAARPPLPRQGRTDRRRRRGGARSRLVRPATQRAQPARRMVRSRSRIATASSSPASRCRSGSSGTRSPTRFKLSSPRRSRGAIEVHEPGRRQARPRLHSGLATRPSTSMSAPASRRRCLQHHRRGREARLRAHRRRLRPGPLPGLARRPRFRREAVRHHGRRRPRLAHGSYDARIEGSARQRRVWASRRRLQRTHGRRRAAAARRAGKRGAGPPCPRSRPDGHLVVRPDEARGRLVVEGRDPARAFRPTKTSTRPMPSGSRSSIRTTGRRRTGLGEGHRRGRRLRGGVSRSCTRTAASTGSTARGRVFFDAGASPCASSASFRT